MDNSPSNETVVETPETLEKFPMPPAVLDGNATAIGWCEVIRTHALDGDLPKLAFAVQRHKKKMLDYQDRITDQAEGIEELQEKVADAATEGDLTKAQEAVKAWASAANTTRLQKQADVEKVVMGYASELMTTLMTE